LLLNSGFRLDEGCFVGLRCFVWEGEGSAPCQSICSVRELDQTDQLSSVRFAFYTTGTGQKGLGCLSRDCHYLSQHNAF